MQSYFRIQPTEQARTNQKIFHEEIHPIVDVCMSHQANEDSRWDIENKESYFQNCILNMAPSEYMFSDIRSCYEFAKERNDKEDMEYFKKFLDKGIEYLNLDSHNRTINNFDIYNDEVLLPPGEYKLLDNITYIVKKKTPYSKLDVKLREAFDTADIDIKVFKRITAEQHGFLFQNINKGKSLNLPEYLNATSGAVAQVIRDLARLYKAYLKEFNFTPNDLNRRMVDIFIAKMFNIFMYGVKTENSEKFMKQLYEPKQTNTIDGVHKFNKLFKSFMSEIVYDGSEIFSLPNKNMLLDCFILYNEQVTNNNKVFRDKANKTFIKDFIDVAEELVNDNTQHVFNVSKAGKEDLRTFEKMVGHNSAKLNTLRNKLIRKKFEEKGLEMEKYFVSPGPRSLSRMDRFKMSRNQLSRGKIKTKSNEIVSWKEIYDSRTHVAHDEFSSYKKTKTTNIEHASLDTATNNLKQGAL
tara:strand:+ start:45 stop:1445 length:1401 start_codon:yes stop_codon:yes gene_type:complete